jgi:SOS-response transcriptional repressor LexA
MAMGVLVRSTSPTPRQLDILRFIVERVDTGLPPTMREIGCKFGIHSSNGINDHLIRLEAKGLVVRQKNVARGIGATSEGRSFAASVAPIRVVDRTNEALEALKQIAAQFIDLDGDEVALIAAAHRYAMARAGLDSGRTVSPVQRDDVDP